MKADRINLTCEICNEDYTLSISAYRDRIRKGSLMLCPKHMLEYRSKRMIKYYEDPANREKTSITTKAGMDAMSPEAKDQMNINRNKEFESYMNNLTNEEKAARIKPLNIYREKMMTDPVVAKEFSEAIINGQQNMTQEAKDQWNKNKGTAKKKEWNNKELLEIIEWDIKRIAGFNLKNNPPSKLEKKFSDMLDKHGIKYEFHYYNKKIHPDFFKLFPNNPITGAKYISPFHQWDLIIKTEAFDILVDIDGRLHFEESFIHNEYENDIKFTELESKRFDDSQRLYQTDKKNAYIIQCPDDKLTKDSLVLHLQDNIIITLKEFLMELIKINNYIKKDK